MHAALPSPPSRHSRIGLVSLLALVVSLTWAAAAQATVVTGAASDPSGDLALSDRPDMPDPPVDFTNAGVRYDDQTGRVDVSFTFNTTPPSSYGFEASVGLGVRASDGSCNAPGYTRWWKVNPSEEAGQLALYGFRSKSGAGPVQPTSDHEVVGTVFDDGPGADPEWHDLDPLSDWDAGPKQTWNFSTVNAELLNRDYICASAHLTVADGADTGEDGGARFALNPASAPPGAAPSGSSTSGGKAAAPKAVDVTPPLAILAGKKTQKLGKSIGLVVRATNENLFVSVSGSVSVPGAAKTYRLTAVKNRFLARGTKRTLKLKLSRKARRAIRRALSKGKKVRANLTVRVRDAAGNSTTKKRTVKLKR